MADMSKRVERYLALVAQAKADVTAIQRHTLSSEPHSEADGLTLAECIANPDCLRTAISTRTGVDTDDRSFRAHASVLQQSLALDIIAPLTIQLFTTGKAPIPDSRFIQLRPDFDNLEANNWHWIEDRETLAGIDEYAAGVAAEVNAWFPMFRQQLGVAPGAYWSSIGLGLSAPFSTLYDRAPATQLCGEARDWLNSIDCDARRYIDWIAVSLNQQHCAIPQRRGCCLAFKLPGGGYCGTCGIYRKQRMAVKRTSRPKSKNPSLSNETARSDNAS